MDRRKGVIIAVVLLLLIGTGSFVFAGGEEEIVGTGNRINDGNGNQDSNDTNRSDNSNETNDNTENNANNEQINDTNDNNTDNNTLTNGNRVNNRVIGNNNTSISVGANSGVTNTDNTSINSGSNDNNINGTGDENKPSEGGNGNSGDANKPNNDNPDVDQLYQNAVEAIKKAENTLKQEDINYAKQLIEQIKDEGQKNELQNRIDGLQKLLDVQKLVDELTNLVVNAEDKEGIDNARDFRETSKVNELVNSLENNEKKNELLKNMEKLNPILDDITSPVINGIEDKEVINQNVVVEIENEVEEDLTIILDGVKVSVDDIKNITGDGKHELIVIDKSFNETKVEFMIDTTKPEIVFSDDVVGLNNNEIHLEAGEKIDLNGLVTVRDNLDKEPRLTLINVDYYSISGLQEDNIYNYDFTNGLDTTKVGRYNLNYEAIDEAGNKVNKTLLIMVEDTIRPVIKGIEDNAYYSDSKEVIINVDDVTETKVYLEKDGEVKNYKIGDIITEDGTYKVYAVDLGGNESEKYTFTIDTTKPVIKGIDNNAIYNAMDDIIITVLDKTEVTVYLEKDGNEVEYILGEKLEDNGNYKIKVVDKAGNESEEYTFTIDTILPMADVKYIDQENGNVLAILENFSEEVTVNPEEYLFEKNGEFTFEITDVAGNKNSIVAKVDWIDEDTENGFEFISGKAFSNREINIKEKDYAYMKVKIWPSTDLITVTENKYIVNKETTYTFTLYNDKDEIIKSAIMVYDGTNPVINSEAIINGKVSNFINNQVYDSVNIKIKDKDLEFIIINHNDNEKITEFTKNNSERKKEQTLSITEPGKYKVTAIDRAGNESVVTFSIKDSRVPIVLSAIGMLV